MHYLASWAYIHLPQHVYLVGFALALVCELAQSHQRHLSPRLPRDLSYFYGEVSLESPQTTTGERGGSRSEWSAVIGAF